MSSDTLTKDGLIDAMETILGENALETIDPVEVSQPAPSKAVKLEPPLCFTQNDLPVALQSIHSQNGVSEIVVGLLEKVPRWKPGSVIKWAAWSDGYHCKDDADHAAKQLAIAAEQWNEANVGVTFEWVQHSRDATFVLVYGGSKGGVLASAFFPNGSDLNFVYVFGGAFRHGWKENMWKVFTHELGHVLGLRHEFAIEKEKMGATQLGPQNEFSVMNYRAEPPELQKSDIESTREFYAIRADDYGNPAKVGSRYIEDFIPS